MPYRGSQKENKKSKKLEIYLKKIVKENFPNLVKEIQVQAAQRVPIIMDAKRPTPEHVIIKLPKVKDNEKLLKEREKKLVTGRLPDVRGRGRTGEEVRELSTNR